MVPRRPGTAIRPLPTAREGTRACLSPPGLASTPTLYVNGIQPVSFASSCFVRFLHMRLPRAASQPFSLRAGFCHVTVSASGCPNDGYVGSCQRRAVRRTISLSPQALGECISAFPCGLRGNGIAPSQNGPGGGFLDTGKRVPKGIVVPACSKEETEWLHILTDLWDIPGIVPVLVGTLWQLTGGTCAQAIRTSHSWEVFSQTFAPISLDCLFFLMDLKFCACLGSSCGANTHSHSVITFFFPYWCLLINRDNYI